MTNSTPGVPSRKLLSYTTPVIALGGAIIALALWQLPSTPRPWAWVSLGLLALVAANFTIKMPRVSAWISISDTFFIASVMLFGPAPATVSIALDSLIMSWRRGHRLLQLLFNPASSAIALWSAAQVYYVLVPASHVATSSDDVPTLMFVPVIVLASVYFALNSGLTVVAVGLDKGLSPLRLWRDHFAVISLNYFAAASAAFFIVVLMRHGGASTAAAVLPLIGVCYLAMRSWLGRVEDAQRHLDKVNSLYMSTIGAFSTAIEAKDGVTSDHVNRVQAYALGLARALGVKDALELQALEAAALLHDTGKLAVPEHVLNKPGRLTPSELETMQAHVDVGADILSSIDFPYPVVPIVRAHHENWDGSGYPRGLKGEEIPMGARILSVVDCYDALTSDRPYRAAMSEQDAIDIIVERRGKMYDPQVVDTFLRVYRDIVPTIEHPPALQSAVRRIRKVHQAPAKSPAPVLRSGDAIVGADSSDELLAFVSLSRIATRTATARDIGVMAATYLRQLAPGATVALMTVDNMRGTLEVQHAVGAACEAVAGLEIEVGHRISGWVAANWQPMVNAQARLDLDDLAPELRYATAVPLVAENRLVGVISIYSAEPSGDLQNRRIEMITPHLAAALATVDTAVAKPNRELRVVARR